jgi:endonuclease YncB( thermonuclease family)
VTRPPRCCGFRLDLPALEWLTVSLVPVVRVRAFREPAGTLARAIALTVALSTSFAVGACAETSETRRYNRARVQESLKRLETPGLLIGEFALASEAVLDGDTIRVEGLDSTLRLVALDCEETIKDERSRRDVEDDWPKYLEARRGKSRRPVKSGTPMGEEAKRFAKKFFADVDRIRLERDDPKEIRDRYDRYLAYAFVYKGGRWINYNVEVVRAGMSPYFTKYSYSRRFHDEFAAAEKEARAAKRGIWNPTSQSYHDYDERKAWWDARAEFIKAFERDGRGRDDFVVLSQWDSLGRLNKMIGQEVTLLGSVGRIMLGDRGPTRVMLNRRRSGDLALIFLDKDVFASTGIARYEGEFVRVSGVVSEYKNEYNHRRQLQVIVSLPSQVVLSDIPGIAAPVQAAAHQP